MNLYLHPLIPLGTVKRRMCPHMPLLWKSRQVTRLSHRQLPYLQFRKQLRRNCRKARFRAERHPGLFFLQRRRHPRQTQFHPGAVCQSRRAGRQFPEETNRLYPKRILPGRINHQHPERTLQSRITGPPHPIPVIPDRRAARQFRKPKYPSRI